MEINVKLKCKNGLNVKYFKMSKELAFCFFLIRICTIMQRHGFPSISTVPVLMFFKGGLFPF